MVKSKEFKLIFFGLVSMLFFGSALCEENIHTYIMEGDLVKVKMLLEKNPQSIHQIDAGFSPLLRAAARGQKEIVELLISKGANVNEQVVESEAYFVGSSPLQAAVFYSYKDIAELLISKGADVNCSDNIGKTPIYMALSGVGNKKEMLELLISKGAHVNGKIRPSGTCPKSALCDGPFDGGWTPLHLAVFMNDKESVEIVISAGANINEKDEAGDTPLYLSRSWLEGKEITEFLIAKGADINAKNKSGDTPLFTALTQNDYPKARFLIEKGADVNVKNQGGLSPLAIVFHAGYDLASDSYTRSPQNLEMIKLLVSKGADSTMHNDGDPNWERLIGKHNQ